MIKIEADWFVGGLYSPYDGVNNAIYILAPGDYVYDYLVKAGAYMFMTSFLFNGDVLNLSIKEILERDE